MANDSETVREVCAEIVKKFFDREYRSFLAMPIEYVREYHNRIENAYEREIVTKDAEIARLKSALKPVIEARVRDVWGWSSNDGSMRVAKESLDDMVRLVFAVREAQRVMLEEGDE